MDYEFPMNLQKSLLQQIFDIESEKMPVEKISSEPDINLNYNNRHRQEVKVTSKLRAPQDIILCQFAAYSQMFTMGCFIIAYTSFLFLAPRTFSWMQLLPLLGLSIRHGSCDYVIKPVPGFVKTNGELVYREDRTLPFCPTYILPEAYILIYAIIIVPATIFSCAFFMNKSVYRPFHMRLTMVCGLVYAVASSFMLFHLLTIFLHSYANLPNNMPFPKWPVTADRISQWWTVTQVTSQCCGGENGRLDWEMKPKGVYHTSCADTIKFPELDDYPRSNEVWQEGCFGKEQCRMFYYGTVFLAFLVQQALCGVAIITSFAIAPTVHILPKASTETFYLDKDISERPITVELRGPAKDFEFINDFNRKLAHVYLKNINSKATVENEKHAGKRYTWIPFLTPPTVRISLAEKGIETHTVEIWHAFKDVKLVRSRRSKQPNSTNELCIEILYR